MTSEFAAHALVLAAWLVLAVHLAVLSWIDFRQHRLPNRWVASAGIFGITMLTAAAYLSGDFHPLGRAVLAGFMGSAVMLLANALGGLGMGDVKLAAVLGLYLGWLSWTAAFAGLWLAFAFAAATVLVKALGSRDSWRRAIPFGPFLSAGTLVVGTFLAIGF
ncbi:MAG: hypothetical protein RJB01_1755 [Actinomycetota bacterium]